MLDSLWARLLDSASHKLAPVVMDSWVRPCRLLAHEGDHLKIGAPNRFSRDWLTQHHLDVLQQAAAEVVGGQPRVSIVVDDSIAPTADDMPAPEGRGSGAGGGGSSAAGAIEASTTTDSRGWPPMTSAAARCRTSR